MFLYIHNLYVTANVMYMWYVYTCGHFIITSSHYCTRNSANLILYLFNYKSIIYYNFVFDANYIWLRDPSGNKLLLSFSGLSQVKAIRPYKKKILVLRHRRALKIPPDETFLSWEGKKIAAVRQISHADKYNFL